MLLSVFSWACSLSSSFKLLASFLEFGCRNMSDIKSFTFEELKDLSGEIISGAIFEICFTADFRAEESLAFRSDGLEKVMFALRLGSELRTCLMHFEINSALLKFLIEMLIAIDSSTHSTECHIPAG